MNMKLLHTIWLCVGLLACSSLGTPERNIPADSTFLSVARSPQRFDGQVVTFRAWISLRHEDKNLWTTWRDHENWETTNCISLENYGVLEGMEPSVDGRYVELTGKIINDASEGGSVLRLGSCRDVAIEITGVSPIQAVVH